MTTRLRAAAAALVLVAGCGTAEPTGARTSLSEKEQQQVKELNEQRQAEWGKNKKK